MATLTALGLNAMKCEPRFRVEFGVTRYDNRDARVGISWSGFGAFETRAFAERVIERTIDPDDYDLAVRVVDLHPERDVHNWGPKLPARWGMICPYCGAGANEVCGDCDGGLPF